MVLPQFARPPSVSREGQIHVLHPLKGAQRAASDATRGKATKLALYSDAGHGFVRFFLSKHRFGNREPVGF